MTSDYKEGVHIFYPQVNWSGMFSSALTSFVGLSMLLVALTSSFETGRPRIALDYGPRLIGLACSDMFGVVKPLCTLSNNGDLVELSRQVLQYARREGATEALVGLPTDSNGKVSYDVRNFNGNLCLDFATVLSSVAGEEMKKLKVLLFDERYTTREAKARMKEEKIRASLDAVAAACLLQRYMEDHGEGALEARPCPYPPPDDVAFFDYNEVRSYVRDMHYHNGGYGSQKRENLRRMQALKEGRFRGLPSMSKRDDSLTTSSQESLLADAARAFGEAEKVQDWSIDDFGEEEYADLNDTLASLDGEALRPSGLKDEVPAYRGDEDRSNKGNEEEEELNESLLSNSDDASDADERDDEYEELKRIRAARRRKGTLKRLHEKK